jgi:hypothetical protein
MRPVLWLLPLVMAAGLSMIYFLPKLGEVADSAIKMELPGYAEGWEYMKIAASEEEINTLSKDTHFAKAVCLKPRPGEVSLQGGLVPDRVDISVVLSGHDMNNSIHRPERCMPAQGHNILSSSDLILKTPLGHTLEVRRLKSVQTIKGESETERAQFNAVTYYFFVGHNQIANDHFKRTMIDMKDRLLRGMDQRWAYVSASMWYGKVPWIEDEVTEEEADEKLREFLAKFADEQIDWRLVSDKAPDT